MFSKIIYKALYYIASLAGVVYGFVYTLFTGKDIY